MVNFRILSVLIISNFINLKEFLLKFVFEKNQLTRILKLRLKEHKIKFCKCNFTSTILIISFQLIDYSYYF